MVKSTRKLLGMVMHACDAGQPGLHRRSEQKRVLRALLLCGLLPHSQSYSSTECKSSDCSIVQGHRQGVPRGAQFQDRQKQRTVRRHRSEETKGRGY